MNKPCWYRVFWMTLVVFLVTCTGFGQSDARNSAGETVAKLIQQSKEVEKSDPDSAYHLLISAKLQLNKVTNKRLHYKVYSLLATTEKNSKREIIASLNAVNIAEQLNDTLLLAESHYNLAKSYKKLQIFDRVMLHLKKAELLYGKKFQWKKRAQVLVLMGHTAVDLSNTLHKRQFLDIAKRYYQLALHYYKTQKDKQNQLSINIALGNLYMRYYAYDPDEKYILKSIAFSELSLAMTGNDTTSASAPYCIGNIGEAYGLIGNRKQEQRYFLRALKGYAMNKDFTSLAEQQLLMAGSLMATKNYSEALVFLEDFKANVEEHQLITGLRMYHKMKSEILFETGDTEAAYLNRLAYEKELDFQLYEEKEQEILRLQVENEIIEKDKQIQLLNSTKEFQNQNIEDQSKIRNLLVIGVLLAFFLTGGIYLRYREKTRIHKMMVEKNVLLQKLSIVASETMNGVIITDKYGIPEWMNEGYQRMFGWDSIQDFIRHTGEDFLSLSSLTLEELRNYQQIAIKERKSITYQSHNQTKSGKRLDIQSSMTPVFNERDELSYWVLVETDITEISIAREVAEREQRITENALKIQELFIANISHEIRTPMNGIMGLSRQLKDIALTVQQKEIATTIVQTATGLLHVVNDLLDLSKIRAGKMNFESRPFDLEGLLENLRRTQQLKFDEKHLHFSCYIDKSMPKWLIGDPIRLNQILLNLTSNAIKFTEKGRVSISVTGTAQKDGTLMVSFAVSDTGIGIPADKQEFVFENFAQLEDHRTRLAGGTGLGLSICKTLAEALGGSISLNSIGGRGSIFTVLLPMKSAEEQQIGNNQTPIESDDHLLEGVCVLLVEDNKINQLVAVYELESWHAEVLIANNAEEGFEWLRKRKVDLILMDISMPKMDGLEATHIIRTTFPEPVSTLPIIALTASAMTNDFHKHAEAGMNDYLSKPYEPQDLYAMLCKWLGKSFQELTWSESESKSSHQSTLVDLELLYERSDGDTSYLVEMYEVFLENMPEYLAELKEATVSGDHSEILAKAHKMLSPARLFKLSTIVTMLEQMMHAQGEEAAFYSKLLVGIVTDFEQVELFLQEELKRAKTEL
ncbi:MAG: ATP-binding protein [Fluviicola sp.]|nr:ATP-binding protein [Fluviicola sp.]